VILVRRGIGTNKLKTPRFLMPDITNDFFAAMKKLDQIFEAPDYYSVGFSMGANRLCKHAGLMGSNCRFKAIVCMATPFDMCHVRKSLLHPLNRLCNFGLCSGI